MQGFNPQGIAHLIAEILDFGFRVFQGQGMNGAFSQGEQCASQFPVSQMRHDKDGAMACSQRLLNISLSFFFIWQQVFAQVVEPDIVHQIKAIVLKCTDGGAPYKRVFRRTPENYRDVLPYGTLCPAHKEIKNTGHYPYVPELVYPGCCSCEYVKKGQI